MSGLGYREKEESHAEGGRLVCQACGHERILTPAWIDEIRARVPAIECENSELLARFFHRFRCSNCQTKNVELIQSVQDESSQTLEENGDPSPLCARCGEAIPIKRLRAVPGTHFCVHCQEEFEHGRPEEPVYCKRCGAKMVWRVRKSVPPTKYFLGCSNYPRCGFVIAGSW